MHIVMKYYICNSLDLCSMIQIMYGNVQIAYRWKSTGWQNIKEIVSLSLYTHSRYMATMTADIQLE